MPKVLFVTGGEKCACKGEGKIEVQKHVDVPIPGGGHPDIAQRVFFTVTEPCPCIEAREATLAHTGTWNANAGAWNLNGTIVPKPADFHLKMELQVPTGTSCSVCGKPQFRTPHGDTCEEGHGGAPPKEEG